MFEIDKQYMCNKQWSPLLTPTLKKNLLARQYGYSFRSLNTNESNSFQNSSLFLTSIRKISGYVFLWPGEWYTVHPVV